MGRLVDADELLDRFANVYFCLGGDRPTADLSLTYHSLCNAVKRAPTVEQPTGKWGKWIISEIQCPNCLEYFDPEWYSAEELKKCPNCRAKMKGDDEE